MLRWRSDLRADSGSSVFLQWAPYAGAGCSGRRRQFLQAGVPDVQPDVQLTGKFWQQCVLALDPGLRRGDVESAG